jgi:hypothetical protein
MSYDANRKPTLDPAAQLAEETRARLRTLPQDQLVDLCAQLLSTYVVEGVLPLSRAAESVDLAADTAGEETFAQMLKRLKATRRDAVLDRFVVDGENISVRVDGYGVLPITEYRRPTVPPGAPAPSKRESSPAAGGSIYNRALYQPEPSRETTAPATAAPQQRPPQQPAQPSQAAQSGKKDEAQKAGSRSSSWSSARNRAESSPSAYNVAFSSASDADFQYTSAAGCTFKFRLSGNTASLSNAPVSCTVTSGGLTFNVVSTTYTLTTRDGYNLSISGSGSTMETSSQTTCPFSQSGTATR